MKRGLWLLSFIICSVSALAYIDPGTGSAIAGSLWPWILLMLGAIGGFFVKYFFRPIKNCCVKVISVFKR